MIWPPTVVVIPTRRLPGIVPFGYALLHDEIDGLDIFDNGQDAETLKLLQELEDSDDRVRVWDAVGDSIYKMWNDGMKQALEDFSGEVNVAVLNDDIRITGGTIDLMAQHLRSDEELWLVSADYRIALTDRAPVEKMKPNYVRGTYRHGGICGWCWMIKGEKLRGDVPFIDEKLQWWYGDDDLAFSVEKAGGRLAIIEGLPVEHEGEGTARHFDELHAMKDLDRVRFQKKWGNI